MATVLLIGERSQVLDELAEIVEGNGHFVVRADLAALDNMDMTHTDVVAFGRALSQDQVAELQSTYRQKNPHIIFVRSLAPIAPLMAVQINAALTAVPAGNTPATFDRQAHTVQILLATKQPVRVTVWWLSIFFHPKMKVILETVLAPGTHTVLMPSWAVGAKYHVTVEIGKRDAYML